MTNYKAGDEVTVRGKIALDATDNGRVRVLFDTITWADGMAVRADMIATHTPKPPELKVGDVVGLAREAVEGVHMRAQIAADEPGADREILVAPPLARGRLDRASQRWLCHDTRPFHNPPLPFLWRQAESSVAPRKSNATAGSSGARHGPIR